MLGRIFLAIALVVIVGGVGIWYSTRNSQHEVIHQTGKSMKVVATFYPLQALAQGVVGELGAVTSIVPGGVEPHDFEPTPKDIKDLYSADLVIINGAGMDPWAEKLSSELQEKGVAVLVLAQSVDLLSGEAHHHEHADGDVHEEGESASGEEHETLDHHEHADETMTFDPHFWLDPVIASTLVRSMTQVLVAAYPDSQSVLTAQSEATLEALHHIDEAYRAGLMSCTHDEVVTSHNAFGYLAKRYGFEAHALAGLSPESEPSAKRLTEIANEVKEEGIKYIFFETLVSPKLSETLAREVGAATLVFNPIEGITEEEQARGENYFSLMRSNLKSLQKALECK